MSQSDPNCLLSVLWGHGRAVALNNFGNPITRSQAISNTFIKAMKRGNEEWDQFVEMEKIKSERRFSYAHLAVTPREIIETEKTKWKSGIATLNIIKTDKGKKIFKSIVLEPDQKMFKSVQKSNFNEEVMKILREAEKLSTTRESTLEIKFDNHQEKAKFNAGPTIAMKRIFSMENEEPYPAGNIPLFCKDEEEKKENEKKDEEEKIPTFSRTLKPVVKTAVARQRDLFECLKKDKKSYNLLPYMENIFVLEWYSVIERHLFRLFCSAYGERKKSLEFEKFPLFNMYEKNEVKKNMEETMDLLFRGKSEKREPSIVYKMAIGDKVFAKRNGAYQLGVIVGKEENGSAYEIDFDYDKKKKKTKKQKTNQEKIKTEDIQIMWYEKWIQDYRAELEMEDERGNTRDKNIRIELVHEKYDKLRRRERQRPPTDWLWKNNLLVC